MQIYLFSHLLTLVGSIQPIFAYVMSVLYAVNLSFHVGVQLCFVFLGPDIIFIT